MGQAAAPLVEAQDQVELVEECLVEKEHRGFDRSRTSSRFGFAVVFGCMGRRLYLFPVSLAKSGSLSASVSSNVAASVATLRLSDTCDLDPIGTRPLSAFESRDADLNVSGAEENRRFSSLGSRTASLPPAKLITWA